jgi:two-component system, NarL family, nitrate/nitrite response regulator NarL
MKPISVYLVDDHKIIVDGIRSLLDGDNRFAVCGFTTDSRVAITEILTIKPDIVISDIQMPGVSGKEIVIEVTKHLPSTKVLTLSMLGDAGAISELLEAGASGYLLKNTGKEELCEALLTIHRGEVYICAAANFELTKSFLSRKKNESAQNENVVHLTPREIEIIALIAKELSNAKIGEALFISERTVETHRKNIFRKTGTKSVLGLVKYATENKLI